MIKEIIGSFYKAKLEIGAPALETIPCSFNPTSYTIKKSANYSRRREMGRTNGDQFSSLDPSELTLALYFDSESFTNVLDTAAKAAAGQGEDALSPITDYTNKILKLVMIKGSEHMPPKVTFCWGNLEFTGYVTSVTQTFTMFTMSGKPIRAKVDLTIRRSDEEDPPFESPDRTKYRTFTEGMSLWALAYEEYGDCEKWRVIARANNLENPLDLRPGQRIRIPAL